MMKSLSLLSAAAMTLILLPSCSGGGAVDVRNPTISQMDDLDVQWGLPRRTSRGTPKRLYPSTSSESGTVSSDTAPAASAPAATTSAPAAAAPTEAPAAAAPSTVDPTVINKLR